MFRGWDFIGADRVASRAAFPATSRGAVVAACSVTPSEVGSNSPSLSSSSSFHRCEFCDSAHERYLDSAREVNRLEGYLGVVEVALKASEGEATVAQAVAADT